MKKTLFATLALAAFASLGLAQKQPQPKSQKEVDAVNAVFQAQDPAGRIAAAENLLQKFHDTEFAPLALFLATMSAEQLGDQEKIMLYGERALKADPKSYAVMLIMAKALAARTREHDLDKEERLGNAEKYANQAGELLKTATKMNAQMSDEQWAAAKKDFEAQQHEALGLIAQARKKYDVAIAEFKSASDLNGDPVTLVRLAQVYNLAGKSDEAIATAEKVLGNAEAPAQVKQFAQAEKVRATQAKTQKK